MKKIKNKFYLGFFFLLFIFMACGLLDDDYLPAVPDNITFDDLNAKIFLDNLTSLSHASHYTIYYKIYLSDNDVPGTINTQDRRELVSSYLVSDYNSLSVFTDTTTTNIPTDNTFSARNYYEISFLNLATNTEERAEKVLEIPSAAPGVTGPTEINIYFSELEPAAITVKDNTISNIYILLRSAGIITPLPDDLFRDSEEIRNNGIAGTTNQNQYNTDVIGTSAAGTASYAYVSMYIVTIGINQNSWTKIYSKPTHIGVFKIL